MSDLKPEEFEKVKQLKSNLEATARVMDELYVMGIVPSFNVQRGADNKHKVENFLLIRNVPIRLP